MPHYHRAHFSFYTTRRRRSRGVGFFTAQKMARQSYRSERRARISCMDSAAL
jgi:hypothetical protein